MFRACLPRPPPAHTIAACDILTIIWNANCKTLNGKSPRQTHQKQCRSDFDYEHLSWGLFELISPNTNSVSVLFFSLSLFFLLSDSVIGFCDDVVEFACHTWQRLALGMVSGALWFPPLGVGGRTLAVSETGRLVPCGVLK